MMKLPIHYLTKIALNLNRLTDMSFPVSLELIAAVTLKCIVFGAVTQCSLLGT